jgi:hypothetical protein
MVEASATHCQPGKQGSTPLSLQGTDPAGKHMVEASAAHCQPGRQGSSPLSLQGTDPAVKHMVEVTAAHYQPGDRVLLRSRFRKLILKISTW